MEIDDVAADSEVGIYLDDFKSDQNYTDLI